MPNGIAENDSPATQGDFMSQGRACTHIDNIKNNRSSRFGCRLRGDPAGARPPKRSFGEAGIPLKININYSRNPTPTASEIATNDTPAMQEFGLESAGGARTP